MKNSEFEKKRAYKHVKSEKNRVQIIATDPNKLIERLEKLLGEKLRE